MEFHIICLVYNSISNDNYLVNFELDHGKTVKERSSSLLCMGATLSNCNRK